jgi:DNA processing protein
VERLERGGAGYPEALDALEYPPGALYAVGARSCLDGAPQRLVAVVGTRGPTAYGLRVAKALGRAVAAAGGVVVSGMARGIDSAAHEGALEAGGTTIAVLGTGPDVPYPASNRRLYERVVAAGLILSEVPPGTKAFPGCFPRRNRIIAALSAATVVVEAGYKSGALNTANAAEAINRPVGAFPGPIDVPVAAGSNLLIRDGAVLLGSIEDALSLAGLSRNATVFRPVLGGDEADLWAALDGGEGTVEHLAEAAGLDARRTLEAVGRLELAGLVSRGRDGLIGRVDVG